LVSGFARHDGGDLLRRTDGNPKNIVVVLANLPHILDVEA
jgi:hypothetical protein